LHAVALQHGLYGIQPLFDAGNRCGVGVHGGALRECLRIMLTPHTYPP
jgi:hypothetical protein